MMKSGINGWAARGRRRPLSGITLGLAAVLAAGCSTPTTTATPSAAATAVCRASIGAAQALWDPLRNGTGGYGDTPSLAAAPSLYTTAWSLRLAAATRTATPAVDRSQVADWLTAGVVDPARFAHEPELTPLAQIQLGVATLRALGMREPADAARGLEAMRAGGLYRSSPSSTPNWPSTAEAADTLAELGAAVPQPVLDGARNAALKLGSTLDAKGIDETGLPVLITLADGQPAADTPGLPDILHHWWNTLQVAGPSPVALGDLHDLKLVARTFGLSMPAVPRSFFTALRNADGYYGAPGAAYGDPQTTFYAVQLGADFSARARSTLALGQVRNGWLASESPPTAMDTYQAAVINTLCGAPHSTVDSRLLTGWIASALAQPAQHQTKPSELGSTLAETCWLARTMDIALPADALELEQSALTAQVRADQHAPTVGRDLAAADACGVTLPKDLLTSLPRDLSTLTPVTMADSFDLYLAGVELQDMHLFANARSAAARLRTTASSYRYNAQAATADIVSTAQGFAICSPPDAAVRARILAGFSTPYGPALMQPAPGQADNTPTVTMASLTAAVILDKGTGDSQYLL